MNRRDFQILARARLKEARVLLKHECFSGAYYLAGYVVECALKACIARQTERYDFPPKPEKVREIYTHDLDKLVKIADPEKQREAESSADTVFQRYWQLVSKWSEAKRYEIVEEQEARDMLKAVSDPKHGVLRWIRRYW